MKAVTIQISDEDYDAVVRHFARAEEARAGRPLVAVVGLPDLSGSFIEVDIRRESARIAFDAKRRGLVSAAAEASETFGDDELERFAEEERKTGQFDAPAEANPQVKPGKRCECRDARCECSHGDRHCHWSAEILDENLEAVSVWHARKGL